MLVKINVEKENILFYELLMFLQYSTFRFIGLKHHTVEQNWYNINSLKMQ